MISQQLIEELKTIIQEEYGKHLETAEVVQIAENLVGYFDLLAKIYHRDSQSYIKTKKQPKKGCSKEKRAI